jgi:hypothetical protein
MNATDAMRARQKARIREISDAPVSKRTVRSVYLACSKFLEQRGIGGSRFFSDRERAIRFAFPVSSPKKRLKCAEPKLRRRSRFDRKKRVSAHPFRFGALLRNGA